MRIEFYQRANKFLGGFMGLSRDELIQNTHFRVLFIKGLYKNVSRQKWYNALKLLFLFNELKFNILLKYRLPENNYCRSVKSLDSLIRLLSRLRLKMEKLSQEALLSSSIKKRWLQLRLSKSFHSQAQWVNFLTLTFIKVRKVECKNWKSKTTLSSK